MGSAPGLNRSWSGSGNVSSREARRSGERMKRTVLSVLNGLGWVVFLSFAIWSGSYLFVGLAVVVGVGPFAPGRPLEGFAWESSFVGSALFLGCALPGLATILATRAAARRLKQREPPARGFEPVMDRETQHATVVPSPGTRGEG